MRRVYWPQDFARSGNCHELVGARSFEAVYRADVGRVLAAAAATALLVAGAAAAAPLKRVGFSPTVAGANAVTFADPAGDSGFVADIVSVAVSNDNQGKVVFEVTLANRPQFTEDDVIQIPIDVDGARYTGHNGFEYLLTVSVFGIGLLKDDNGAYTPDDAEVEADYTNGVLRLALSFRDLADTAALRFYVAADSVAPSPGVYDWAPDGDALFSYSVDVPLLVDRNYALDPAKAGKTFAVGVAVTTNNATPANVTCSARLGTRLLAGKGRWKSVPVVPPAPVAGETPAERPYAYKADVECAFALPKKAKGKPLRGTLTATKNGVTVRRAFAVRVG
jgi:hypothetical protein